MTIKRTLMRTTAMLISAIMLLTPLTNVTAYAWSEPRSQSDTLTISNGSVELTVSKKNGGFAVRTINGDIMNKDDDNKDLLYRRGEYDTSFTSFRVTKENKTKDYVFGNDYSFLGLFGNGLTVAAKDGGIDAEWTVDDITFVQRLEPVANESAATHGTVKISYSVINNTGKPIKVENRILLDTALGSQDFAYYELADGNSQGSFLRIETEQDRTDYIPTSFFAYNNYQTPTIAAYTINDPEEGAILPQRISFGHWNNMAATIFDFNPISDLNFTNTANLKYQTADSAMSLYYRLGDIDAGEKQSMNTYYGVSSNLSMQKGATVSVTALAPTSLTLNETNDGYLDVNSANAGIVDMGVTLHNASGPSYKNVAFAIYTDEGVIPLDVDGKEFEGFGPKTPAITEIVNFQSNQRKQLSFHLKAVPGDTTEYRKLTLRVYNMEGANGLLLGEKLLGEYTHYLLCPGKLNPLPPVIFSGAQPNTLYKSGNRHMYVTGSGFSLLDSGKNSYTLQAINRADKTKIFSIGKESILFEKDMMDIVFTEDMPTGQYDLSINWGGKPPENVQNIMTSPALTVIMTDNPEHKNDYYGIVAAIKSGANYELKNFKNEAEFSEYNAKNKDNVLVFAKGEFTQNKTSTTTEYVALSSGDRDTITINNVLDVEKGSFAFRQENGKIAMTADASIYTSGSRTAVWKGKAAFTTLVNGKDFGLIEYDKNGERESEPANVISFKWSSDLSMLQTIGGFPLDLRFGELGTINDGSGYTMSFGGMMDLSFLMPGGIREAETAERKSLEESGWNTSGDGFVPSADATAEDDDAELPSGRVEITDVLYGNNKGLLGINANASIYLPKYVAPLPKMGGAFSINTIGDYKVGVSGQVKCQLAEMEFELLIKSKSGVPVPDKLYFFIGGFDPGINVDMMGVLWIQGGGGGIDKLYDTIFGSGVPPLTLMLSTQFSIMQIMGARADLSLSLRGFDVRLGEVKLMGADELTLLDEALVSVNWYPNVKLQLAANVTLFDIINGGGYIVADVAEDVYEGFVYAGVAIPNSVPIFGGMKIANASLGLNNTNVWGNVSLLGAPVGIRYYWSGGLDVGTAGGSVQPTYPELVSGYSTRGFKAAEGLYMVPGSNLSVAASTADAADSVSQTFPHKATRSSTPPPHIAQSDKKNYTMTNLGDMDYAIVSVKYSGDSRPTTANAAKLAITYGNNIKYDLQYHDNNAEVQADDVNASFVNDTENKASAITFSIPKKLLTADEWKIKSNVDCEVILLNAAPLPGLTSVDASLSGDNISVNWRGNSLSTSDKSFWLVTDEQLKNGHGGVPIGIPDGASTNSPTGGNVTLAIPKELQGGSYLLQMGNMEDGVVAERVTAKQISADFRLTHVNSNEPLQPTIAINSAGNGLFKLSVSGLAEKTYDGVTVSVFEQEGTPTDFVNVEVATLADGTLPEIVVGGRFPKIDEKGEPVLNSDGSAAMFGLEPGKSYYAQVSAYKNLYESADKDAALKTVILGKAGKSGMVLLPTVNPPNATLKGNTIFTTNKIKLPIGFDQEVVTGGYSIDGALAQEADERLAKSSITEFSNKNELEIEAELADGSHTITVWGKNSAGDSFHYSELFTVDTMPPKLVLSAPLNGSFFETDGTLSIEGLGDSDARYSLLVDGVKIPMLPAEKRANLPDESISFTANIGTDTATKRVDIVSTDAAGNSTTRTARVQNRALSQLVDVSENKLLRSLMVTVGEQGFEGNNISLSPSSETQYTLNLAAAQLVEKQRKARSASGTMVINDPQLVSWRITTKEGSATIDNNGSFVAQPGSIGFVEAELNLGGSILRTSATFGAEAEVASFLLSVQAGSGGRLVADPSGLKKGGQVISLAAIANTGYRFDGWQSSNGGTFDNSKSANCNFTMPANATNVTAVFSSIDSSGGGSNGGSNGSSGGSSSSSSGSDSNSSSGSDINNESSTGTKPDIETGTVSTAESDAAIDVGVNIEEDTAKPQPDESLTPEQSMEFWNAAMLLLDKAAVGEVITMDMAGISTLPASYLKKLCGMGVTVLLKMEEGYTWQVNGNEIPATTDFSRDIVLAITLDNGSVFKKISKIQPILAFSVDPSVTFPMTLLWRLDGSDEGAPLFLYRYQKDMATDLIAKDIVTLDSVVRIPIGADGSYALCTEQIGEFAAKSNSGIVAIIILAVLLAIGGFFFIAYKKGRLQKLLARLTK